MSIPTAAELRALGDVFTPTTTEYTSSNDPVRSGRAVVLPPNVLADLHDPDYLPQRRGAALAKLSESKLVIDPAGATDDVKGPRPPAPFANFLRADASERRNRGFTANAAAAYVSTKSPTLDVFYSLNQKSQGHTVHSLLQRSWASDAETTLKLIVNLRSIGEGKNNRETFYRAFGWLLKEHTETALGNLKWLVAQTCEDPRNIADRKKREAAKDVGKGTKRDAEGEIKERQFEDGPERPARSHGCFKDLLCLVSLDFHGQLKNPESSQTALKDAFGPPPRFRKGHRNCDHIFDPVYVGEPKEPEEGGGEDDVRRDEETGASDHIPRQTQFERQRAIFEADAHNAEAKEIARTRKREDHEKMVLDLAGRLEDDKLFRSLYVAVAHIFADALKKDIAALVEIVKLRKSGGDKETITREVRRLGNTISLAAKWAPSSNKSFDRQFLFTSAIAEVLFPFGGTPDSLDRAVYAHAARAHLRRQVLTPLRRFLAIPESNMHPGKWDKIRYSQVPAVCFSINKALFFGHDAARYVAHMDSVSQGKKTISGSSRLPHELVLCALGVAHKDPGILAAERAAGRGGAVRPKTPGKHVKARLEKAMTEKLSQLSTGVYDAQWESMVSHTRAVGSLDNCIAVCDVSGSMGGIYDTWRYFEDGRMVNKEQIDPIFAAIGLSILVAQVARPPWNNMFITFSATPKLQQLPSTSADGGKVGLAQIVESLATSSWDENTNFAAVFLDLILPTAQRHSLKKEDMVKRIFVFSDMQFDQAAGSADANEAWKTEHDAIKEKFEEAGYDLPELVYWNLKVEEETEGTGATAPVTHDAEGVTLMAGFSGAMLKAFMGDDEEGKAEQGVFDKVKEDAEGWDVVDANVDGADVNLRAGTGTTGPGEVIGESEMPKKARPEDKMRRILGGRSYAELKVLD